MVAKEYRLAGNMAGNTPFVLITIALALMCQVYVAGAHTGGSFNPAVSVALTFECDNIFEEASSICRRGDLWIYILAPYCGGIFAGLAALGLGAASGMFTDAGVKAVKDADDGHDSD